MFIEKPASNRSINNRKPIQGVGINDAGYAVSPSVNGKRYHCPYYRRWEGMIKRCYSKSTHKRQPTYKDCTVCDEWLIFSNFKSWMIKQDWHGKHLDKDILVQGNKYYSPKYCVFVTKEINYLLGDCKAARGDLPQGVSYSKRDKQYLAHCSVNGKVNHVGVFTSPEPAFKAYKKFKYKLIANVANKQSEPLRSALLAYRIN